MSGPSEIQMHEQPNPTDHTQHDLLAVAAYADRGATGEEADRARAQIAACTACAALHADLVSLASATRVLPPIERPRDFRLRPQDAQRLRPNLIRRLFGSFGTPRDGFSRPLALGLTTLGLAGLMLGVLPGTLSLGGATSAPGAATDMERAMEAPAPGAPTSAPAGGAPPAGAAPTDGDRLGLDNAAATFEPYGLEGQAAGQLQGEDGPGPVAIAGRGESTSAGESPLLNVADDRTGVSQLVVISGTLLIIGLGLFALRWTSRRFGG